jgi:hypothetical protein
VAVSNDFPDDLISAEETAADLHVKPQTLASWRATGLGPDFFKLGRAVYYSRKVTAEWKAKQRRSPGRVLTTA